MEPVKHCFPQPRRQLQGHERTREALRPTALGLVVAMVLQIGRGYLAVQAEAITQSIHEFSARLINALIDRPDVRSAIDEPHARHSTPRAVRACFGAQQLQIPQPQGYVNDFAHIIPTRTGRRWRVSSTMSAPSRVVRSSS